MLGSKYLTVALLLQFGRYRLHVNCWLVGGDGDLAAVVAITEFGC